MTTTSTTESWCRIPVYFTVILVESPSVMVFSEASTDTDKAAKVYKKAVIYTFFMTETSASLQVLILILIQASNRDRFGEILADYWKFHTAKLRMCTLYSPRFQPVAVYLWLP